MTLTTILPAAPTRKSGSQGQHTGDPGGRFQGSHRSGRGLCHQNLTKTRERWDSFLMGISNEGLVPAHSGDSYRAGRGDPPSADQVKSGVWVKVGSCEINEPQLLLYPQYPTGVWGANRPRAVLQGPAESRGYQRLQRASRVPKNLGVHRVSGFRGSQRISSGCVCCVWGGGGFRW